MIVRQHATFDRGLPCNFLQSFKRRFDCRDRRAELVAGVGDEIRFHLHRRRHCADISQHQQNTARLCVCDDRLISHALPAALEANFAKHRHVAIRLLDHPQNRFFIDDHAKFFPQRCGGVSCSSRAAGVLITTIRSSASLNKIGSGSESTSACKSAR